MTGDELRELERNRQRAFWAFVNLRPDDPNLSEPLILFDSLDVHERENRPSRIRHLT
ncbi:hypothetical protein SAMN05444507_11727 [Pseudomonas syringae]|nr:hypothetical protein SAMN05444507_11727 [Pseudomonas syringae]